MSFNETASNINGTLASFELVKKGLQDTMQAEMKKIFSAFFEEFPQVKTIHWTQYTPHFSDGDECIFSMNEMWFTTTPYTKLSDREVAYGEGDEGLINDWGVVVEDEALSIAMDTMERVMASLPEEVLKATYGDGVWVRVHKDGADVEEYEHD